MHSSVNRHLLNPSWDEKTACVVADDLHLEHAVHVGNPVIDPLEAAAGALYVAAEDTAEKAAVEEVDVEIKVVK